MTSSGTHFYRVALLALALSGCGGGTTAIVPGRAADSGALVPLAGQSTLITATFKGKPIAGILITLSRNRKGGPVIGKGKTGGMGRVRLHGSWTMHDKLCAWGVYVYQGGRAEAQYCATPFPDTLEMEFGV
ncbi:MAG: hypothetical protein WA814_12015 [Candidatus Baltobacteraceae bacterium]